MAQLDAPLDGNHRGMLVFGMTQTATIRPFAAIRFCQISILMLTASPEGYIRLSVSLE
jgi:hypothetical protein